MPRLKKGSKAAPPDPNHWKSRYHAVSLSYNDEKEIAKWYVQSKPSHTFCLEEMVDTGWAVKITPPVSNDSYMVSFTGKSVDDKYNDRTYSVWYSTYIEAIIIAYYVSTVWRERGMLPTGEDISIGGFLDNLT